METNKQKVSVTITKEHMEKAIAATNAPYDNYTSHCLLAQAGKDVVPDLLGTGLASIRVSHGRYTTVTDVYELVALFDAKRFEELQKMLPATYEFHYQSASTFVPFKDGSL